jgi:hypothetical protein
MHADVKNLGCYLIKDLPPAFWGRFRRQVLLHNWRMGSNMVREGHASVLLKAQWNLLWLGPRMLRKRRALGRQLRDRGQTIVKWVETPQPAEPTAAPTNPEPTPAPTGKLWRNLVPAATALLLLWPLHLWLMLAALQDRLTMSKT